MDQDDFLKQLSYRKFLQKDAPFNSLKNVCEENEARELGTWSSEHTLHHFLL